MILITGGTGFIGRILLKQFIELGMEVRSLLRPTTHSPRLPAGIQLDVTISSLTDFRGIRAACNSVKTVIHLASSEHLSMRDFIPEKEITGTRNLAVAAAEAGVERFIFLSHLGAHSTSAYTVSRTKALEEDVIRKSGVPFTIIRPSIVYGPEDHFTTKLASQLAWFPLIYFLPGHGDTLLQPLWVNDLTTAMTWTLDDPATIGQTYEVGGPEYLSFRQILEMVMSSLKIKRFLIPIRPSYIRLGAWLLEHVFHDPPISSFWMDYLSINRIADLNSLLRVFSLQPTRMEGNLGYLEKHKWIGDLSSRKIEKHKKVES